MAPHTNTHPNGLRSSVDHCCGPQRAVKGVPDPPVEASVVVGGASDPRPGKVRLRDKDHVVVVLAFVLIG
jgi:hypothetical protein